MSDEPIKVDWEKFDEMQWNDMERRVKDLSMLLVRMRTAAFDKDPARGCQRILELYEKGKHLMELGSILRTQRSG